MSWNEAENNKFSDADGRFCKVHWSDYLAVYIRDPSSQIIDTARIVCRARGLWNGRASVCLSVLMSHHLPAARRCGGFAAERRAGRRYWSTTAGAGRSPAATPQHCAQQQIRAVYRKLNLQACFLTFALCHVLKFLEVTVRVTCTHVYTSRLRHQNASLFLLPPPQLDRWRSKCLLVC